MAKKSGWAGRGVGYQSAEHVTEQARKRSAGKKPSHPHEEAIPERDPGHSHTPSGPSTGGGLAPTKRITKGVKMAKIKKHAGYVKKGGPESHRSRTAAAGATTHRAVAALGPKATHRQKLSANSARRQAHGHRPTSQAMQAEANKSELASGQQDSTAVAEALQKSLNGIKKHTGYVKKGASDSQPNTMARKITQKYREYVERDRSQALPRKGPQKPKGTPEPKFFKSELTPGQEHSQVVAESLIAKAFCGVRAQARANEKHTSREPGSKKAPHTSAGQRSNTAGGLVQARPGGNKSIANTSRSGGRAGKTQLAKSGVGKRKR